MEQEPIAPMMGTDTERQRVLRAANDHFVTCLRSGEYQQIRKYLRDRGMSDDTINMYQLGYDDRTLPEFLSAMGFNLDECIRAGVLRISKSWEVSSCFGNYITFPVFREGKMVSFIGRSFSGSGPKYLKPPGPFPYLYPGDVPEGRVYVVEGSFDALTLTQAGSDAVAVVGSNLTENQAQHLSGSEEIYLAFDGDQSGYDGALRAAKLLGPDSRIIKLPQGKDPNELLLEPGGAETFRERASQAKNYLQTKIAEIPEDTPKTKLYKQLEPILKDLSELDDISVNHYLDQIQKKYGLSKPLTQSLRSKVRSFRKLMAKTMPAQQDSEEENRACRVSGYFPGLVDIGEDADGKRVFIYKNEESLEINNTVKVGEEKLVCPRRDLPFLLPRVEEVLHHCDVDNDRQLFDDMLRYLRRVSYLPHPGYYHLLAAYTLLTYRQEAPNLRYLPIIWLYAFIERGKSRTGEALTAISYRGVPTETLREAYLIRSSNGFHSTIFLDVMDLWKRTTRAGSEDVLLNRFEKGKWVARVLHPEEGDIEGVFYFYIFGPTIAATNEYIPEVLASRAIEIRMKQADREYPPYDREEARTLKERLTAYRARHLDEPLPGCEKAFQGRFGDITQPLLQVVQGLIPAGGNELLEVLRIQEREKIQEKLSGEEAKILEIIYRLCQRNDYLESEDAYETIRVSEITKKFNEGRNERFHLSSASMGRKLKAMGFDKTRDSRGNMLIKITLSSVLDRMERLGMRLMEDPSEPSDPSETTEYQELDGHTNLQDIQKEDDWADVIPDIGGDEESPNRDVEKNDFFTQAQQPDARTHMENAGHAERASRAEIEDEMMPLEAWKNELGIDGDQ